MPPKRKNGNNPINPPTPSDLSTSTTPGLRSGKSFKFLNYDKGGNFNNKWLQWQSGHQLLHHREKMPQVIETDRPRMVTEMDRASFGFDTKILHPDDVPDLEFIPPPRVIESTVKTSYLNAGYGMRPALYRLDRVGICTTETVRLIKEVCHKNKLQHHCVGHARLCPFLQIPCSCLVSPPASASLLRVTQPLLKKKKSQRM